MMTDKKIDPLIDKTVGGKYQILAFLGAGNFGSVYKAFHSSLKKNFALKTLHSEHLTDETIATRFQHEAIITSRLNHPNIVSATDHGLCRDTNVVFIVMEYVEGTPLRKLIKDLGKLDVETALGIAIQLCKGIDHAHTKNVLHRDIKPSNILLTECENNPYFVKISDFGIAKVLEESEELKRLTRSDAPPAGTYQYMAPEQFLENYKPNARSDIYSIGCVLFEMLMGKPPYDANSLPALMHMHCTAKIPLLESDTTERVVQEHLQNIIEKALAKEPSSRYEKVSELNTDLEKLQSRVKQTKPRKLDQLTSLPEQIWLSSSRVVRRANIKLAKLSTRNWILLGIAIVVVVGATTIIFQSRYAQDFVLPKDQRTLSLQPAPAADTATDRHLFEEKEKQFLDVEKSYRIVGKMSQADACPVRMGFGYFYLRSKSPLKAFQQFHKAEELLASLKIDDALENAKVYLALAESTFDIGNYPEAIKYAQETMVKLLPLKEQNYYDFGGTAISALHYLGRAALLTKNMLLADAAYKKLFEVANYRGKDNKDPPYFTVRPESHSESFFDAGEYFLSVDKFDYAQTFFHYAIDGWHLENNLISEATTWNELGLVYIKTNQYQQATDAFKKSASLLLSSGSPQPAKFAKVLFNQADAEEASGEVSKSIETRNQARMYWFKSGS